MFRLLKLLFWLAVLGGFVWFGATVPLGNRTLFQHLRAISQSKESQELWEGTKEKADDVRKRFGKTADGGSPDGAAPAKPQRSAVPQGTTQRASRGQQPHQGASQPQSSPQPQSKTAESQDQLTEQDRRRLRKVLDATREHVKVDVH